MFGALVLAQYSPNPLQFLLTGADGGNFSRTQRPNVLTPDIENQKTDLYSAANGSDACNENKAR